MEIALRIFLVMTLALSFSVQAHADETALFSTVAPDALIILDLSGSMSWNPAGGADATNIWGNSSCTGSFYPSSGSGHETDCSRITIAKRALFGVLDDNQDGSINSQDESSLNIRFGYMRFYDCNTAGDSGADYNAGCNRLIREIGSKYSRIFCDSSNNCSSTDTGSGSISSESALGGTTLVASLNEARLYLNANKAADPAKECRQKFVVLVTDGMDTFSCGGDGTEYQSTQYKRRRESVAAAKALADAGYTVFVIGFGSAMPSVMSNTLNWMAYYGGTDNPAIPNVGDATAFDPSLVTTCVTSTTVPATCTGTDYDCYASSNDPGNLSLSGFAFIAGNPAELRSAMKRAFEMIREVNCSFSQASVSSSRVQDENYLYEGSFQPINADPFWLGHLRKYAINNDGTVGSVLWDAGQVLQSRDASGTNGRNIKTYINGSLTDFTTSISQSYFDVTSSTQRDMIVGFIRGESASNRDNWKLGDVFRSNPVTVGTPSYYFIDQVDTSNNTCNAFCEFRNNHVRTSALSNRLILAGANDGQVHAFKTSDGSEAWSFIPPNFLPKLKNIAHSSHPSLLTHQYFVDGPISVADVWFGNGTGQSKSSSDWRTVLIFGEGRGGSSTLWSSSSSCDSGFNNVYTASYPYYCGYYAFNLTTSTNLQYLWRLTPTTAESPYLGEPWSKVYIGRVRISGNERWVGFVGGGYNASDCRTGGCDARGKGFFIIDIMTGLTLWSYTHANDGNMDFSIPSPSAIVDYDNDGFIDTVYVGDLGNNLWRFKLCLASDGSTCSISDWRGGLVYQASTGELRPIFTMPSVARDANFNLWVYWGTGDKTDPTAANAQEKFYALKDDSRTGTYRLNNLDNITTGVYIDSSSKKGWYINLSGSGEKVIAEPAVFGGVVYFTSYTPRQGGNPCDRAGDAKLYAVDYVSGSGILSSGSRSMDLGIGIPTSPVLSFNPVNNRPDLYVTVSGGGGASASTARANINPPNISNRVNLLFWRDTRIQP
jgi:hypothetical protein